MYASMTFDTALKVMRHEVDDDIYEAHFDDALRVIIREVTEHCKTDTGGLVDWLALGEYKDPVTAQSIAAEWDALAAE